MNWLCHVTTVQTVTEGRTWGNKCHQEDTNYYDVRLDEK